MTCLSNSPAKGKKSKPNSKKRKAQKLSQMLSSDSLHFDLNELKDFTLKTNKGDYIKNLVLSNKLIKVELPSQKIWKADVSGVSPFSKATRKTGNL